MKRIILSLAICLCAGNLFAQDANTDNLVKEGDKLLIVSVIDNLLKGASGTAVHNMNLLFGLHERVGLNLKASAF